MTKNSTILEPLVGEKGFVYLLGDTEKPGIYKIGVTRGSIARRIKKLQTGNSGEIYICKYFRTDHPFFIEKQLHKKYCYDKILNEWFELSDEEVFNFEKSCEFYENLIETMKDNPFFPKKVK